jgi:hypothetical protein
VEAKIFTFEVRPQEEALWTPERQELELMSSEEKRQRTHEKWQKEVAKAAVAFNRKKKIQAQRQQLLQSLRQVSSAMNEWYRFTADGVSGLLQQMQQESGD